MGSLGRVWKEVGPLVQLVQWGSACSPKTRTGHAKITGLAIDDGPRDRGQIRSCQNAV